MVNTEATVADREREIVDAENQVRASEDRLKRVLNIPPSEWGIPIKPSESLQINYIDLDYDSAVQRALEARPEIRKSMHQYDQARLEYKFQKNQMLPELNISASYTSSGTSVPTPDFETGEIVLPILAKSNFR